MRVDKKKFICAMIDAGMDNKILSQKSGVSSSRVSNIKNGQNTTYETLSKLSRVLGVNVLDLCDLTEGVSK